MRFLLFLVNILVTTCIAMTFLLLITIADPIVKLVSAFGKKCLAKDITRKTASLVQLLPRAWGTTYNFHLNPNSGNWDKDRPIIFVSSHHSCFDIVLLTNVLGGLLKGRQFSFISRSGLDKYIPLISFYLREFCYSLPVTRAGTRAGTGSEAMSGDSTTRQREAQEMLAKFASVQSRNNSAVVIFPEGMKDVTLPEHNAPFRRNGLRTLLESMPDAILVPVAITGTRDFYTTGRKLSQLFHQLPKFSTKIELSILPVIEAESIEQKIDLAEQKIANEYMRLKHQSVSHKPGHYRSLKWIL